MSNNDYNSKILTAILSLLFVTALPISNVNASAPAEASEIHYGVEYNWSSVDSDLEEFTGLDLPEVFAEIMGAADDSNFDLIISEILSGSSNIYVQYSEDISPQTIKDYDQNDVSVWSRTTDVTIRHGGVADGIFIADWAEQVFGEDPSSIALDLAGSMENMVLVDMLYTEYFNDDGDLVGADMLFNLETSTALGVAFDVSLEGNGETLPVELDLGLSLGYSITNSQSEWRLESPSSMYTTVAGLDDDEFFSWDLFEDGEGGLLQGGYDGMVAYSMSMSGIPTEDLGLDVGELDLEISDQISKTGQSYDMAIEGELTFQHFDSHVVDLGDGNGMTSSVDVCENCPPANPVMFLMMEEVLAGTSEDFAKQVSDQFADQFSDRIADEIEDLFGFEIYDDYETDYLNDYDLDITSPHDFLQDFVDKNSVNYDREPFDIMAKFNLQFDGQSLTGGFPSQSENEHAPCDLGGVSLDLFELATYAFINENGPENYCYIVTNEDYYSLYDRLDEEWNEAQSNPLWWSDGPSFQCKDGTEISLYLKNNNHFNCQDRSDEIPEQYYEIEMYNLYHHEVQLIANIGNSNPYYDHGVHCDGRGLFPTEINNGYQNCDDGSDEPIDNNNDGIIDNLFMCENGDFITVDKAQDGTFDCADESDEGYYGNVSIDYQILMDITDENGNILQEHDSCYTHDEDSQPNCYNYSQHSYLEYRHHISKHDLDSYEEQDGECYDMQQHTITYHDNQEDCEDDGHFWNEHGGHDDHGHGDDDDDDHDDHDDHQNLPDYICIDVTIISEANTVFEDSMCKYIGINFNHLYLYDWEYNDTKSEISTFAETTGLGNDYPYQINVWLNDSNNQNVWYELYSLDNDDNYDNYFYGYPGVFDFGTYCLEGEIVGSSGAIVNQQSSCITTSYDDYFDDDEDDDDFEPSDKLDSIIDALQDSGLESVLNAFADNLEQRLDDLETIDELPYSDLEFSPLWSDQYATVVGVGVFVEDENGTYVLTGPAIQGYDVDAPHTIAVNYLTGNDAKNAATSMKTATQLDQIVDLANHDVSVMIQDLQESGIDTSDLEINLPDISLDDIADIISPSNDNDNSNGNSNNDNSGADDNTGSNDDANNDNLDDSDANNNDNVNDDSNDAATDEEPSEAEEKADDDGLLPFISPLSLLAVISIAGLVFGSRTRD